MRWDPQFYLESEGHSYRRRAAVELLEKVSFDQPSDRPSRIVDLGCGCGDIAELIARRWSEAELIGVDRSPQMLERARRDYPTMTWRQADIETWEPDEPVDLIYCNAALQWIDDHERLLPRLVGFLPPGGILAVQMPRSFDLPCHTAIRETVASGDWRARLSHLVRIAPVMTPAAYYRLLHPHAARADIWESEYLQVLHGADPVVEWTRATALRPFLDALDDADQEIFLADYRERIRKAYPTEADRSTLFPFRRLFMVIER